MLAVALLVCGLMHGVTKEQTISGDKIHREILALTSGLISVTISMFSVLLRDGRITLGVPVTSYIKPAVAAEFASSSSFWVLKCFSFPIMVMAKSAKLLPTMIAERLRFGKQHKPSDYLRAIVAVAAVVALHLAEEVATMETQVDMQLTAFLKGALMMLAFYMADAYTTTCQEALYKEHPHLSQVQMMFGVNLCGLLMSLCRYLYHFYHAPVASFAALPPGVLLRVIGLGLTSTLTQLCIFTAMRTLGASGLAWVQTWQKLLSVLLSLALFGSGIDLFKLACTFTVFTMMSWTRIMDSFECFRGNVRERTFGL